VREEGAVVFIAPTAAPAMLQLLATIGTCSSTLRGLWMLVPDAGTALPHGGAHVAVEPASMDRMLEAAGRLAESDVGEAGLREALARSQGSLALLAVLLQSAARTTEHGVTLQAAAPSAASRTTLLADATGLPPVLCEALSSCADRAPAMLTHGWGAPNGASRSAPDRPSLVDQLPQALLWEDPSTLLGRLEDAVDRGDASGRSVNAALLATRSRLGIANHEVVVDIIEERCQTSIQYGSQLEPAEALAYALMMSHARMRTAVSEASLDALPQGFHRRQKPLTQSRSSLSPNNCATTQLKHKHFRNFANSVRRFRHSALCLTGFSCLARRTSSLPKDAMQRLADSAQTW